MWRLGIFLLALLGFTSFLSAESIRVTTWNLEWFPNGSPNDAPPEIQARHINEAAEVLRKLDPDVILLQEVKDHESCSKLATAIRPQTYTVSICSAFRDPFVGGIGRQQVAILSKQPAQAAWMESWNTFGRIDPPRGFSFAWIKIAGADLGIYCLHLKSNLVRGDNEREIQRNILKRELSTEQIIAHLKGTIQTAIPSISAVIVGGDFNTNMDERIFVSERTLQNLTEYGFKNCWDGLSLEQRITHPGKGRYPDSTFDYLFIKRGICGKPHITATGASDHLPVTCDFELPKQISARALK